jgi:hypothetical protein
MHGDKDTTVHRFCAQVPVHELIYEKQMKGFELTQEGIRRGLKLFFRL